MSTKLTLETLDQFLSVQAPNALLEEYVRAAAVLSAFDPFQLKPFGGETTSVPRDEVLSHLLPLCDPVNLPTGVDVWTLLLPPRREALKALATREQMKKAVEANPARPVTVFQKVFEQLLEEQAIELDQLSRDELAGLLEVLEWVEDILDGLPQRTAVSAALARTDLLSPMERLAGHGFVGREAELARLSAYVFESTSDAPLFVFGTGGVGKSTLLARFMLAHALPENLAIVYIDVDRSTIRPDQPLTVLLDFVTQLHPQLGVSPSAVDSIVKEITFAISRKEDERHFESAGFAIDEELISFVSENVGRWLNGRRALLIIDTMEEAQFLGDDVMWPFVQFLLFLNQSLKELRVILSGRSLPVEYLDQAFPSVSLIGRTVEDPTLLTEISLPERPLNLTELNPESARKLLRSSLPESKAQELSDSDIDDVIAICGRNPMCLKLAARLLEDEGVEKLRSERSEVFTKLKAEKIQALLYGRILRHIHNDEVRKVAYPGLIVRRIDVGVIREVLAGPCKLDLRPDHNEYHIFEALSREHALMFRDPQDGSLRHRADVRRSMLEDLSDHIDETIIEEIDSNAVTFYSGKDGAIARAEEIYHRLRLKQEESILDSRWIPEAEDYLQGALNELSPQQRLWLAERLNVTLDDSVRQAASQEAWEAQAARSADRYLKSRLPEEALKVLHERETRSPRSQLYFLETECYRFLDRPDEALAVARRGVDSASRAGAIDMVLDLLLKMVVIEEGRGDLEAAEKLLKEASAVSANSSDELMRLRVKTTSIRLQRQLRPADSTERASLKEQALKMLSAEMLKKLRDHPVLLREVAAELAKQHASIAAAAIETLGVEVKTDAQAEAFGRAINNIEVDLTNPTIKDFVGKDLSNLDYVRKWATEQLTSRDTRKLSNAVASAQANSKVLGDFRNYFRAGVSSALKGRIFDEE